MRMQVIMESLFAHTASAPIGGGKKGEFRAWTSLLLVTSVSIFALNKETKANEMIIITSYKHPSFMTPSF